MSQTFTISSPHAHDHSSVNRVMLHVCLALLPATAFGLYVFGFLAVNMLLLTIGSALLWESLCFWLLKQPQGRLFDGSALLTGWLLAMSLPAASPWWLCVGGSFVGIVLGKQMFGGLGQNIFNPAMLARVALLISFPVQMTTWTLPGGFSALGFVDSLNITFGLAPLADGFTGATSLGLLKTEMSTGVTATAAISEHVNLLSSFFGTTTGSFGETSSLLILCGGAWLLIMRIISWHIPAAMLASIAIIATVFNLIDETRFAPASFHLLSGGAMLGAFFIATDLVTSPSSKAGQLIFGAGCGLLTYVIRTWGSFPEGIGFAVLFMNALTPLIDIYFRPRVYGRRVDGTPISYSRKGGES